MIPRTCHTIVQHCSCQLSMIPRLAQHRVHDPSHLPYLSPLNSEKRCIDFRVEVYQNYRSALISEKTCSDFRVEVYQDYRSPLISGKKCPDFRVEVYHECLIWAHLGLKRRVDLPRQQRRPLHALEPGTNIPTSHSSVPVSVVQIYPYPGTRISTCVTERPRT